MKLAISNIAWQPVEDAAIAGVMKSAGVQGVEIAPTKLWPDLRTPSEADVRAARAGWEARGFPVIAIQSLLFGRPELVLFQSESQREELFTFLKRVLDIGQWLGAGVAVFGSPKNRQVGAMPPARAEGIAQEFFARVGEEAERRRISFCIEPNPSYYACDFVTTSRQGAELVRAVHHPGFGLHLDAAAMTLSQEPMPASLVELKAMIRHFHASEPDLSPLGTGKVDHRTFAQTLRTIGYDRWVSVEMRQQDKDNVPAVEKALAFVKSVYG